MAWALCCPPRMSGAIGLTILTSERTAFEYSQLQLKLAEGLTAHSKGQEQACILNNLRV